MGRTAMSRGSPSRSPCDVSVRLRSVGATVIVAVVALVGGCSSNSENQPQGQAAVPGSEYRNAEYVIEGQRIKLADGLAALKTEAGYLGSDGYLLGDRIAPQTTEVSRNPRHKNVIVVNYGDRRPDEPMTAQPSVSKSVYLKLDAETVRWGIVVQDFEGESR